MKNLFAIWYFFDSFQKKKAISLFVLGLVCIIFETVGIGSILPLVKILLSENLIENNFFQNYFLFLSSLSYSNLIKLFLLLISIIFFLKFMLLVLFNYYTEKFCNNLIETFSTKLLNKYLLNNYDFFVKKNTGEFLRDIDAAKSISSLWRQYTILVTEILLLIFVTSLLIYVDVYTTLFVVLFILSISSIYYLIFKKKLKIFGEKKLQLSSQIHKSLLQSFGGIKMIKLSSLEEFFTKIYENFLIRFNKIEIFSKIILFIPRYFLEILAIFAMCLIVSWKVTYEIPNTEIIATLALFGFAGFKIIPAASKILNSLSSIKYALPASELVLYELRKTEKSLNFLKKKDVKKYNFGINEISLHGISFRYSNNPNDIFDDLNLTLRKGTIYGIVGNSGTGKSTLLDIILGLLKITNGSIIVNDKNLQSVLYYFQSKCGYVAQNTYLMDESIRQNIIFGKFYSDQNAINKRLDSVINLCNLKDFINSLPEGVDTVVGDRGSRLSIGQIQRIGLARALYHDPEVLILDEFTSALDPESEKDILNNIKVVSQNKIVILSSHKSKPLEYCDKIFQINNKKLLPLKFNEKF
mgnify:CR=1 FL=1